MPSGTAFTTASAFDIPQGAARILAGQRAKVIRARAQPGAFGWIAGRDHRAAQVRVFLGAEPAAGSSAAD